MAEIDAFLQAYGYWLLLAVGFSEYAGVPIASVPVLIAAGGLAAAGTLSLPGVVVAVAAGGLLADAGWFAAARWRGRRLVDAACSLTSNLKACVLKVERQVARLGAPYILVAKFVPGAGNLVAPASGFARVRSGKFLTLDAIALLAWAGVYAGLGWIFSEQVMAAVELILRYVRGAVVAAVFLIVAAVVWRVVRSRRHTEAHAEQMAEVEPDGEPAEAASA